MSLEVRPESSIASLSEKSTEVYVPIYRVTLIQLCKLANLAVSTWPDHPEDGIIITKIWQAKSTAG